MDVAMKDQAPNLLELFEARAADVWGDEKTASDMSEEAALAKTASGASSVLAFLSVCSDENPDICSDEIRSVCSDETPGVCSDETLSVCADEFVSDARLKTDIEQVGTTVYGLPLYHFSYNQGGGRFEGVMAQDVLEVMPSAVITGADGFHRVRYGDLGITMRRL